MIIGPSVIVIPESDDRSDAMMTDQIKRNSIYEHLSCSDAGREGANLRLSLSVCLLFSDSSSPSHPSLHKATKMGTDLSRHPEPSRRPGVFRMLQKTVNIGNKIGQRATKGMITSQLVGSLGEASEPSPRWPVPQWGLIFPRVPLEMVNVPG